MTTHLPTRTSSTREHTMLSCLTPLVALSPVVVLLFWITTTTASPWSAIGVGALLVVPGFAAARALAEPPKRCN